jgi:predicted RNase H-like nuclease (RuvC/YqgF family)
MGKKNSPTSNIPKDLLKEIEMFCDLNKVDDPNKFLLGCLKGGFAIEKFGRTPIKSGKEIIEKEVEKEVIREVEKIVEVVKLVEREVPVEVEKIVTKTEYITDDSAIKNLLVKIESLEDELKIKPKEVKVEVEDKRQLNTLQNEIKNLKNKIEEYEDVLNHFRRFSGSNVTHLASSRLNDNLYKD